MSQKKPKSSKYVISSSDDDNEQEAEVASSKGRSDGKDKKRRLKKEPQVAKKKKKNLQEDEEEEELEANKFPLGKSRFVTVSEFRGQAKVDIRQYYNADGELRPGKAGISLTLDQYETLKKFLPKIDAAIENV
eukprot:m.19767 g.19767  ORF g.19767 m.19767 type:complete len:133 (+) comp27900_c0_seq2:400-798(+)